jgi:CRISPR-associated protein Csx10
MTTVTLTLSMLSDWHVGTGTGRRGYADSLVKRDSSGFPFVPAKTITGIWRDACEVAAYALDAGPAGPWHDWTEYLFGSQPSLNTSGTPQLGAEDGPRSASLSVRSLHYERDVTDVLNAKPRLAAAVTFLKPGVAIDRTTGRAKDRQLRYEEVARAGAVLTGAAHIAGFEQLEADQQCAAASLLAAGARLVESIGGKRRRGAGRCTLKVGGMAADLDWLAGCDQPPAPPASLAAGFSVAPDAGDLAWPLPAGRAEAGDWEIADLGLELRTPVVAHLRTVGNAVSSLDYVPGWLLLPAALRSLAAASASGHEGDVASAARAGDLIVTNATLDIDGHPGRPAPLPLAGYVGRVNGGPSAAWQVRMTEHVHNAIEDAVQRPTEIVGGLYTYEAISAGTVLRAQVRVPAGLLRPGWQALLSGEWRIGRSSKDDYGQVVVTSEAAVPATAPVQREPAFAAARSAGSGTARLLRVWVLSDLLVTDQRLRPSSDPADVARVLSEALGGVTLSPAAWPRGQAVANQADRRLESWQRKWGLPRPSMIGIAGGSLLTFSIDGPGLASPAVRQVELAGIGLRRSEGFGQISIDDPLLEIFSDPERVRLLPAPVRGGGSAGHERGAAATISPAEVTLRGIEQAAWRQAIAERAESLAATDAGRRSVLGAGYAFVPATQLSALRVVATALGGGPDDRTRYWLSRLTASGREKSWPPDVRARLESLLTDQNAVWQLLELPEEEMSRSPDSVLHRRGELWATAVQAVTSACLTNVRRIPQEDTDG